jgi:AmmeMemoRadiSam system protein B
MSPRTRPPAAAGTFYPALAGRLARTVDGLLEAVPPPPDGAVAEGLIVPHAGYAYSGPVAATAYASLRPIAKSVTRVVVLGPAHFVPLSGSAVPAADAWSTPLGDVRIDEGLRDVAIAAGAVADDGPHEPEHSLEVQLPFLQRLLGFGISVLPVAVGATSPEEVADLLAALWHTPGGLVVVSTDLSHYHAEEVAKKLDRRTADAIVARDPAAIGLDDACGVYALRGVVEYARRGDIDVRLLDLRTSADTAGDPSRVVGYGAFALASARSG